jgi:hypothetical protein
VGSTPIGSTILPYRIGKDLEDGPVVAGTARLALSCDRAKTTGSEHSSDGHNQVDEKDGQVTHDSETVPITSGHDHLARVAIVNESFVRRFGLGADVIAASTRTSRR